MRPPGLVVVDTPTDEFMHSSNDKYKLLTDKPKMRFVDVMKAKMTPEWRSQYYLFKLARQMIIDLKHDLKEIDYEDRERLTSAFEKDFVEFNEKELVKIDQFFQDKLNEAKAKQADLNSKLDDFLEFQRQEKKRSASKGHGAFGSKLALMQDTLSIEDFQIAFSEFYLNLILIQNFQELNLTAFRKIFKKYDKALSGDKGARWMENFVQISIFGSSRVIEEMIDRVEDDVANKIHGGDRKKAMSKLRVPPVGEPRHSAWTVYRMGLWSGLIVALFAAIIALIPWSLCNPTDIGCWRDSCNPADNYTDIADADANEFWVVTIRLYRGVYLLALMVLLLGINSYGWAASGINHVLIFELDPRDHLSSFHLIELGFGLITVTSISLIGWLMQFYLAYVFQTNPVYIRYVAFAFFFLLILLLFNPLPIFMHKSRFWLIKILFRIVTAPFNSVRFADFWLADQFTSLVPVFQDFVFIICCCTLEFGLVNVEHECDDELFIVMNVIGCLPAWFRFAQCVRRYFETGQKHPHLTNAGKYSTTFLVIIFKSLHSKYIPPSSSGSGGTTLTPSNTTFIMPLTNLTTTTPVAVFDPSNPFLYCWILSATLSTCYTYSWDVKMDWGLLAQNAGPNRFLREHIVFQHRWYYYVVMVLDLIFRLSWTLTVANFEINDNLPYLSDLFITSLTFAEMFRRFVWNFFRLENEHVNNVAEFRAVRDISIESIDRNHRDTTADEIPPTEKLSVLARLRRWWRASKLLPRQSPSGVVFANINDSASIVAIPPTSDEARDVVDDWINLSTSPSSARVNTGQVRESFARSRRDSTHFHPIS